MAAGDEALRIRQKLAASGIITIALAVTAKGELAGVPDVMTAGIPARTREGAAMDAVVDDALFQTFDQLPRQKAARRGRRFDGDRKGRPQRGRIGVGQAPVGACAGGRSLSCRPGARQGRARRFAGGLTASREGEIAPSVPPLNDFFYIVPAARFK